MPLRLGLPNLGNPYGIVNVRARCDGIDLVSPVAGQLLRSSGARCAFCRTRSGIWYTWSRRKWTDDDEASDISTLLTGESPWWCDASGGVARDVQSRGRSQRVDIPPGFLDGIVPCSLVLLRGPRRVPDMPG